MDYKQAYEEILARLIDRTDAYGKYAAKLMIENHKLKNEMKYLRICFAQASHNDCQAGPIIHNLEKEIERLKK